jgi:hypothetical protein
MLSLVVELKRNLRDQLDLRVAEGPIFYDGRHVWALEQGSLMDKVSGENRELAQGSLFLLDRQAIFIKTSTGILRCDTSGWPEWSEIPAPPGPHPITCQSGTQASELRLNYPGPNGGFIVQLDDHNLKIRLPQDTDPEGQVVMHEVERIVGIRWIQQPSSTARPVLERLYRGRASVNVPLQPIVLDGDLSEWVVAKLAPLVVEREWHLESGGENWLGARDISFSIAAARTVSNQLCFAGRARDDDRQDQDAIELRLLNQRTRVSLAPLRSSRSWSGVVDGLNVVIGHDWYGVHYELCTELPPGKRIPFAIAWVDKDAGQMPTILASAPALPDQLPAGQLLLE